MEYITIFIIIVVIIGLVASIYHEIKNTLGDDDIRY